MTGLGGPGDGTRSLESLRELLNDPVHDLGPEKAAEELDIDRKTLWRSEGAARYGSGAETSKCNRSGLFSQWVACKEKWKVLHRAIGAISKAESGGFRGLGGCVRGGSFSRLCVGFIAPIVLQF